MSKVPLVAIVDDDEDVRIAMESLVRSLRLTARTFASAEAFLASDIVGKTACLISDVKMPGMRGLDLQDALLAQGRQLPIIFVTAYPDERSRSRAQAQGAAEMLIKPFDAQSLADCLMRVLQRTSET